MDRLAVWQLALPAEEHETVGASKTQKEEQIKEVRDWTQAFCEEVVRPLCVDTLHRHLPLVADHLH